MAGPQTIAIRVPAARKGPNGTWSLRLRRWVAISDHPDERAEQETEEEPEQHLTPAEPPEVQPEHERELHVAEPHAPR